MAVRNICVIRLHCPDPECWSLGAQNCAFDRLQLKVKLKQDRDIKATGGTCHHTWSLSNGMKAKLRRTLSPGSSDTYRLKS
jgi:hypothetical protein